MRRMMACAAGNFGLMTALLFPVVLLAGGIAVDFSMALAVKADMEEAANSAVLGALNNRSKGIVDALTNDRSGRLPTSELDAGKLFLGNLGSAHQPLLTDYHAEVRREDSMIKSELFFKAAVPTSFLGMFDIKKIDITGVAKAEFAPEAFYDFHILLDNSPSMGIGTTAADIRALEAAPGIQCAFACHNLQSNTYKIARDKGISVRIDVVALALSRMIERAAQKNYENQYRMALYSFGARAAVAKLTEVTAMTDKLAKVSEAAANVKLMSVDYFGENSHWLSDFDTILSDLAVAVQKQPVGRRQKVALIISDGMNDSAKSAAKCKYQRFDGKTCWQPADPIFCEKVKTAGAKVAILYTTFFPIPRDDNYRKYIAPWQPNISSTLRDCASPGLFFEISASEGIDDALNALFIKITNTQYLSE